jgi:thiol-disulfide isomerase/thioredoxin
MGGQNKNFSAAGPDLSSQVKKIEPLDIPRFATNSPFGGDYNNPMPKEPKRLWARSCLWDKAPDFVVEKWLTKEPAMKGKYLLVEFWGTWCSQCRRAVSLLNGFHEKYEDRLAVIAISDEKEQVIRKFAESKIEYNLAMDRQGRMQKELAVQGWPHIIIIEPGGHVIWEGFPFLKGYELTDELIEKILAVGDKTGSNG